jgi:hypothetical protein
MRKASATPIPATATTMATTSSKTCNATLIVFPLAGGNIPRAAGAVHLKRGDIGNATGSIRRAPPARA